MRSSAVIAYQRTGQHVVMRAVSANELDLSIDSVTPESLNRLILSKNPLMFMESIDELGILSTGNLTKKDDRIRRVGDVRRDFKKGRYQRVRLERLGDESGTDGDTVDESFTDAAYLDSASALKHNASALSKAVVRYDAIANRFPAKLEAYDDDDLVVVDLLEDWTELRNALSVTGRVLGWLRREQFGGDGLVESGFEVREVKRGKAAQVVESIEFIDEYPTQYQIPFTFNPFHALDLSPQGVMSYLAATDTRTPFHATVLNRGKGWETALKGTHQVCFLTAPVAKMYKHDEDDKGIYLCIGDDGSGWREIARTFASAMINAYMRPEVDLEPIFCQETHPEVQRLSLVAALWYQLIYSDDYELITCRNCGNAVLTTKKGMGRVWCSDACRTYYRAHHLGEGGDD